MNYATLSSADVKAALEAMAQDTMATFGHLSVRQLNWRPDAAQWSVAQCCEHLLTANRLVFASATDALGLRTRQQSGSACRCSLPCSVGC